MTRLVRPIADGGYGLDALWNDDFHHSAMVALTGRAEAYYTDTRGEPQEFISAAKYGYLFQGQQYHWQRDRRGSAAWGLPPSAFIAFTQNHDQVGQFGARVAGPPADQPRPMAGDDRVAAAAAGHADVVSGQEFSASAPFLYFADFEPELNAAVRAGRGEFLTSFRARPRCNGTVPWPILERSRRSSAASSICASARRTPSRSRCTGICCGSGARRWGVRHSANHGGVDGAVLSASAFMLRFFTSDHRDDRVLVVNLGGDLERASFAEPLLAPPPDSDWHLRWSSDNAAYGGPGIAEIFPDDWWHVPGESAVLLTPGPRRPRSPLPRVHRPEESTE